MHIYDTLLFYKKYTLRWFRVNLTEDKKSSFDIIVYYQQFFIVLSKVLIPYSRLNVSTCEYTA